MSSLTSHSRKWASCLLRTAAAFLFVAVFAEPARVGEPTESVVALEQAVRDGKAEIEIRGLGGSTGDAILVTIRRKVAQPLRLTVTRGLVFRSDSGTVQNMLAAGLRGERVADDHHRPADTMVLLDDARHTYLIEAYCLDFQKPNPGPSDSFSIAPGDERATRILQAGKARSASIAAIQSAIWIDREGVLPADLQQRFPATAEDIAVARELLRNPGKTPSSSVSGVSAAGAPGSAPAPVPTTRLPVALPPAIPVLPQIPQIPKIPVIPALPPMIQVPPKITLPALPPGMPASVAAAGSLAPQATSPRPSAVSRAIRTWTDSTGQFRTEAQFVDLKDGMVRLKKQDGNIVSVPMSRLSKVDQEWVNSSSAKATASHHATVKLLKAQWLRSYLFADGVPSPTNPARSIPVPDGMRGLVIHLTIPVPKVSLSDKPHTIRSTDFQVRVGDGRTVSGAAVCAVRALDTVFCSTLVIRYYADEKRPMEVASVFLLPATGTAEILRWQGIDVSITPALLTE